MPSFSRVHVCRLVHWRVAGPLVPDLVRAGRLVGRRFSDAHEIARQLAQLDEGRLEVSSQGRFTVPVARTFDLQDWRAAMQLSLTGRAGGKLLLLP